MKFGLRRDHCTKLVFEAHVNHLPESIFLADYLTFPGSGRTPGPAANDTAIPG